MVKRSADSPAKKNKHLFSRIIFGVCLFGFIICAIGIVSVQWEHKNARDTYSDLRQNVDQSAVNTPAPAAAEETPDSTEGDTTSEKTAAEQAHTMDFEALHALSPDIVGWIKAEGTNVDYPVLQGEDNEQYLHHLYNGEYNASGSIFMDYRVSDPATDRNLVLYGHHMADGSMFQSLTLYKEEEFYEEHPTMMYYAPEGDYLVELICGTVEDASEEFVRFTFTDDADLQSYVDGFRERSTFRSDVTLQPGDRIISLCTCTYEQEDARYMIIGRLVPVTDSSS